MHYTFFNKRRLTMGVVNDVLQTKATRKHNGLSEESSNLSIGITTVHAHKA